NHANYAQQEQPDGRFCTGFDFHLLSVVIPSTLLAVLVMSFLVTMLFNSKLSDDPIYRKRLEEGLVELRGEKQIEIKSGAKTSVWLFLLGVVGVVIYAIINQTHAWAVDDC
ncbi:anaerobic C4-dicarboxylate transporter family protein, partial [Escherichia sp. R-CC3]